MNYVYILKSSKDDELYIGSTTDLKRRFNEHNNGKVQSTQHRKPFTLIYYEAYKSEQDARIRESKLKQRGNTRYHLIQRLKNSFK